MPGMLITVTINIKMLFGILDTHCIALTVQHGLCHEFGGTHPFTLNHNALHCYWCNTMCAIHLRLVPFNFYPPSNI